MARDKQSEFRTGAEPVTLGLDELMSDASPTWEAMPWHPGLARIGHSVPEASWAGSRSGATDAPPAPPLIGSHCRAQSLGSLSESGSDAGIVVRINKCCSRATLHPRRWLDSDQRSFFFFFASSQFGQLLLLLASYLLLVMPPEVRSSRRDHGLTLPHTALVVTSQHG